MKLFTDRKSLIASLAGFGLLFGTVATPFAYGADDAPEQTITTPSDDELDEAANPETPKAPVADEQAGDDKTNETDDALTAPVADDEADEATPEDITDDSVLPATTDTTTDDEQAGEDYGISTYAYGGFVANYFALTDSNTPAEDGEIAFIPEDKLKMGETYRIGDIIDTAYIPAGYHFVYADFVQPGYDGDGKSGSFLTEDDTFTVHSPDITFAVYYGDDDNYIPSKLEDATVELDMVFENVWGEVIAPSDTKTFGYSDIASTSGGSYDFSRVAPAEVAGASYMGIGEIKGSNYRNFFYGKENIVLSKPTTARVVYVYDTGEEKPDAVKVPLTVRYETVDMDDFKNTPQGEAYPTHELETRTEQIDANRYYTVEDLYDSSVFPYPYGCEGADKPVITRLLVNGSIANIDGLLRFGLDGKFELTVQAFEAPKYDTPTFYRDEQGNEIAPRGVWVWDSYYPFDFSRATEDMKIDIEGYEFVSSKQIAYGKKDAIEMTYKKIVPPEEPPVIPPEEEKTPPTPPVEEPKEETKTPPAEEPKEEQKTPLPNTKGEDTVIPQTSDETAPYVLLIAGLAAIATGLVARRRG